MNESPTAQSTNNTLLAPSGPPSQASRKTLQETIHDIETQISRFEELEKNASLNTRQEQDLNKLRELLNKALTEQERVKSEKLRQQEVQLQLAKGQGQPVLPNRGGRSGATMSDSSARYSSDNTQVLSKKKIQDLVKEIDPNTQLDEDVEEMLLQIADDFIENIVTAGCQLAKHRKSSTLEVKDVLLHLERNWNMWIPGYSSEESRQHKRPAATESHKQRLALIRKALKK
ncbi:Transcription initiation factor TFIID subunit 12 [Holothuria leucospilota]|uniref:Transcription initiation factor TFIID subunit 12 n=1 Tax=Holothuria leucospilota TaxID=206669 RepID=A0A9Q1BHU0_HOLLE|nr:Transcription initiation factor TFIID subunit 12 [Holothuria leucospilota]